MFQIFMLMAIFLAVFIVLPYKDLSLGIKYGRCFAKLD